MRRCLKRLRERMNERPRPEKPKTPSGAELWLEKKAENVTLAGKDEMLQGLRGAMTSDDQADIERNFYPKLLAYAGQQIPASRVPAIIMDAAREYLTGRGVKLNLRGYSGEYIEPLIDVMITDPEGQRAAHAFLKDALNG